VSSPAPYDWDLAETEFDTDPTPLAPERPAPAGWEPPGRGNGFGVAVICAGVVVVLAVVVLAVLL
jgi:hypothetical protein